MIFLSKSTTIKTHYISFSCSSHATEDIGKVVDAVLNLLPEKMREEKEVVVTKLEGHAGNPIHLLELEITKQQEIRKVLDFLSSKLDEIDKIFLYEELDERLDEENSFYFRLNKQDAYKGDISLAQDDNTIRIVVKFIIYKNSREALIERIEELGLVKKE